MRLLLRTTNTGTLTRFSSCPALLKVSFRLKSQSHENDCPGQAARAGEAQASGRSNRQAPPPHRVSRRQDCAVTLACAIILCMALTRSSIPRANAPVFPSWLPNRGSQLLEALLSVG